MAAFDYLGKFCSLLAITSLQPCSIAMPRRFQLPSSQYKITSDHAYHSFRMRVSCIPMNVKITAIGDAWNVVADGCDFALWE